MTEADALEIEKPAQIECTEPKYCSQRILRIVAQNSSNIFYICFQIITTTSMSTRSVTVTSPAPTSQNTESIKNYVKKIQLVKSLLGLRL